jgi:hypothetical protein
MAKREGRELFGRMNEKDAFVDLVLVRRLNMGVTEGHG